MTVLAKNLQRTLAFGLPLLIGLVFATGFSNVCADVVQARKDGSERVCRDDWNDPLLRGVHSGTEAQWRRTLESRPELLVRMCSTNVRCER